MFGYSTKSVISDLNTPFQKPIDIPETLNFYGDPEELVYDFFWEAYFEKPKKANTPVSVSRQAK